MENVIQEINPIITKPSTEKSYVIFTCDFDINLLEMNSSLKYPGFLFTCNTQFLSNNFKHSILWITGKYKQLYSGILLNCISVYSPHFTYLDIMVKIKIKTKYVMVNKNSNVIQSFCVDIKLSLKHTSFSKDLSTDLRD